MMTKSCLTIYDRRRVRPISEGAALISKFYERFSIQRPDPDEAFDYDELYDQMMSREIQRLDRIMSGVGTRNVCSNC